MKPSDIINPHETSLQGRSPAVAALHGDYKYIKAALESLSATVLNQQQKIQKLQAFVAYYATCPCCNEDEECSEGCTFKEDDWNAYDMMQLAREAMK